MSTIEKNLKSSQNSKNLTNDFPPFAVVFFILIMLSITTYKASATTATWNGGTSSSWNDGTNWTGGAGAGSIPGSAQDVDIPNTGNAPTMDVSGGTTIATLLIEDGQTLTLDGSNQLIITGSCTLGTSTSGVLTTNGSALTIEGALTGTGGTLDISANTSNLIKITGNIVVGTITAGSGTSHVQLNGTGQQINSYTFNTLEITGTIVMEDNLRVNLNLTGTGTLDAGNYILKLMQNMTIKHFTASNSLVELIGTATTQTIGTASAGYTFKDFGVYNTNTSLANDITITDNLDFGAVTGVILLNNFNLTISPGANGTGTHAQGPGYAVTENASPISNNYGGGYGYIVSNKGNNGGALIMTVTTSPTIFPIGATSASYSPLTLTSDAGSSVVYVTNADSLLDGKNPQSDLLTSGSDYAVIKTWKAHNTSNIAHMTVNTTWHAHLPNTGDEDANFSKSQGYISYRLNQLAGTNWQPLGPTSGSTASSDATDYWNLTDQAASHLNMSTATDYYIATGSSGSTALPVSLVSLSAQYSNNYVNLDWATASEINNDYFDIERSTNAVDWKTIDRVQGHGNSEVYNSYTDIDNLYDVIPSGTFYYRLKQVDYNGSFQNSSIRSINISAPIIGLQTYPNPTGDILNVKWANTSDEITTLRLVNISGVNVLDQNVSGIGVMQKQLNLTAYPAGIYFIQIITDQKTISQIVNKN